MLTHGTDRFSSDGAKTLDHTGTGSDEHSGARFTAAAGQSGAAAAEGLGSGTG
jgi:hypothetical protein